MNSLNFIISASSLVNNVMNPFYSILSSQDWKVGERENTECPVQKEWVDWCAWRTRRVWEIAGGRKKCWEWVLYVLYISHRCFIMCKVDKSCDCKTMLHIQHFTYLTEQTAIHNLLCILFFRNPSSKAASEDS